MVEQLPPIAPPIPSAQHTAIATAATPKSATNTRYLSVPIRAQNITLQQLNERMAVSMIRKRHKPKLTPNQTEHADLPPTLS